MPRNPAPRKSHSERAAKTREAQLDAHQRRLEARLDRDPNDALAAHVINQMTNWQRSQWARAGYPGLADNNPAKTARFTRLVRTGQHKEL